MPNSLSPDGTSRPKKQPPGAAQPRTYPSCTQDSDTFMTPSVKLPRMLTTCTRAKTLLNRRMHMNTTNVPAAKLHATSSSAPRWLRGLCTIAFVALLGCGVEDGETDATEDDLGAPELAVKQAAVINGYPVSSDDYTGIVRIFAANLKFSELRQFCTGVLLRSNLVLTARHCLEFSADALAYGWPDVHANISPLVITTDKLGFAAKGVGAPIYAPGGRDIAAFKIDRPLPIRSQGKIVNSGYARRLPALTSGQTIATFGYGETTSPGVPSTVCKYVSLQTGQRLKGCLQDPFILNFGFGSATITGTRVLTVGVVGAHGDSGGPVFVLTAGDFGDLKLAAINSNATRCVPNSSTCGADGARVDDLGPWLGSLPY